MNTGTKKINPNQFFLFFWQWLFKYSYKLKIGEAIESSHLAWNQEQHILTPKYNTLRSFFPLKHYHVDDNDKPIKFTCKCCKRYGIRAGKMENY